jgi:hypothetical protein
MYFIWQIRASSDFIEPVVAARIQFMTSVNRIFQNFLKSMKI